MKRPDIVPFRKTRAANAGITLVETVVSIVIIALGLGALYMSSAQSFALLRRAKEIVAAREVILSRIDDLRALSYAQLANSSYVSANAMQSGAAGDASPFGSTTNGMRNFKETVTVYALGSQVFSNDSARINATPDSAQEYASQVDSVAPAAPKTYKSNSTTAGDWTLQVANALPSYTIIRTGTGTNAALSVTTAGTGSVGAWPQLRLDVNLTWTDSNNVARSQVASTIVSNPGSLQ
jgi:hypothetical protein